MKNRLRVLLGSQARVIEGVDGTLHIPLPNRLRWLEIRRWKWYSWAVAGRAGKAGTGRADRAAWEPNGRY